MSWLWGGGKEARSDGRQDMITSTSKKDEEQSQEKEGGFWGFIESVKEKSKEVASAYKEDIGVFASTLKDETKEVMKEIRTEEGKAGLFLDGWSSALQKVVKKTAEGLESIDHRFAEEAAKRGIIKVEAVIDENELEKVETSDSTYIADPRGEGYAEYRRSFHLKSGRGRIENVLATNAAVSAKYNSLVKTKKVDEELFWARYLFAIDDMHRRAEKKEELRRAMTRSSSGKGGENTDEEDLGWDDEDEVGWGEVESRTAPKVIEKLGRSEKESCTNEEKHAADAVEYVEPQVDRQKVVPLGELHPTDSEEIIRKDEEEVAVVAISAKRDEERESGVADELIRGRSKHGDELESKEAIEKQEAEDVEDGWEGSKGCGTNPVTEEVVEVSLPLLESAHKLAALDIQEDGEKEIASEGIDEFGEHENGSDERDTENRVKSEEKQAEGAMKPVAVEDDEEDWDAWE